MEWEGYKRLADTPGVWSRWMLEQTLELLQHPQLTVQSGSGSTTVARINDCLGQSPIPKPVDHKGGAAVDMFRLELQAAQVQDLLALIHKASGLGITTSGTVTRGLGGFTQAWQEYLDSIPL